MDEIEFKTGDEYINRKGSFEVLDIDGEDMQIRWENGETVWTEMEFQRRIIQNMTWEKNAAEAKELAAAKKARSGSPRAGAGRSFEGLLDKDFSRKITGTNWRSRNQLGGAVTRRLDAGKLRINSWAVYRMSRIHWLDMAHRDIDRDHLQARFFASTDPEAITYGLHIERSNDASVSRQDWDALMSWLNEPENDQWLQTVAVENQLVVYDMKDGVNEGKGSFTGRIHAADGKWHWDKKPDPIDRLTDFLDGLPPNITADIIIARQMPKAEALEKSVKIAEDIAALFKIMLPLYSAAISHMR